jgi:hypothetical protein
MVPVACQPPSIGAQSVTLTLEGKATGMEEHPIDVMPNPASKPIIMIERVLRPIDQTYIHDLVVDHS